MSLSEAVPASLGVELFGQRLNTPLIAASGTCGFGLELAEVADLTWYGALVLKTLTLEARKGNPPPRMVETPAGMLNSIGLQNPGIEVFRRDYWPGIVAKLGRMRFILSVGGEDVEEFVTLVEKVEALPEIFALELNLSCPNIHSQGAVVGAAAATVAEIIASAKAHTSKPVIAKLSPNVADVAGLAQAAESAGADAISVVNTFLGTAVDVEQRKFAFANQVAGLSGPAIRPLALQVVAEVAQKVQIPVLGLGGISNWRDAAEFLLVGANCVQLGTVTFVNPNLARDIGQGLVEYLQRQQLDSISELVGAVGD